MANLLFKSGFEDNTVLSTVGNYKYFSGKDVGTGFTWPIKSVGGATDPRLQHIGSVGVQVFSEIQTVIGHTGKSTKALYRKVIPANEPGGNFRQVVHQLNGMTASNQKIYVKMWMKVDATSFTGTNRYRAIWEYKTYGYEQPAGGFRVAAYMNMDSNGNESWEFRGDTKPGFAGVVWSASNKTIPFPKEEWFKLEYFIDFKVDGSATGRVWMKINDQLIGDKANVQTSRNNQKMQALFLSNLYGANGNIEMWVDDLEIWDDVPDVVIPPIDPPVDPPTETTKSALGYGFEEYNIKGISELLKYFDETGFDESLAKDVDIPSAFMNWCQMKAGKEYTKSLDFKSWLGWGVETIEPSLGDVVVIEVTGRGYVGFYLAERKGRIYILGISTTNQVKVISYPVKKILGYRK